MIALRLLKWLIVPFLILVGGWLFNFQGIDLPIRVLLIMLIVATLISHLIDFLETKGRISQELALKTKPKISNVAIVLVVLIIVLAIFFAVYRHLIGGAG